MSDIGQEGHFQIQQREPQGSNCDVCDDGSSLNNGSASSCSFSKMVYCKLWVLAHLVYPEDNSSVRDSLVRI